MQIIEKLKSGQPVKLAFLGDSITEGCFEGMATAEDNVYVYHTRLIAMIMEKYPTAKIETINAGIAGNISGQGLFRMKQEILDKKPDFCCVCFGVNDTAFVAVNRLAVMRPMGKQFISAVERNTDATALAFLQKGQAKQAYSDSLDKILHTLHTAGIETVLLLPNGICPLSLEDKKSPNYAISKIDANLMKKGKMDRMMEIARGVAKKNRVPVADAYTKWKAVAKTTQDIRSMFSNGINHPTRALHTILAEALFDTMMQSTSE